MHTVFLSEKLRARDYLGDRWRRADYIEMDLIQTTRERVNWFKESAYAIVNLRVSKRQTLDYLSDYCLTKAKALTESCSSWQ
jgi:hypothetical protein